MTIVEILRLAVSVNAVLLLVQSIRVIATYQAVYVLSPKDWKRQLPLHVWLMALAFFMYVAVTAVMLYINDGALNVRVIIYGIAGGIAQYALWNILKYDRRRYSRVTNFQDPDTDTDDEQDLIPGMQHEEETR